MRYNPKPESIPANLPADAVGFIGRRKDKPERLASFLADGSLSGTHAIDETMDDLRAAYARHGCNVDAAGIIRRDA